METIPTRWVDQIGHRMWLGRQLASQLRFATAFPHPDGGSFYLDASGRPDTSVPVHTWITARMLHVYSLGHLCGLPGSLPLAERALAGLQGRLRDHVNGGWYVSVGPNLDERDAHKAAYTHAFVAFAASSAAAAGVPRAHDLLGEALDVLDRKFWEDGPGMHLDRTSEDWLEVSAYRGVNANMHAVEALLSASDVTGEVRWRARAARITSTVLGWAEDHDWRIPEHFGPDWTVNLEHHRTQPDHPFEPYGATVGHGLEWARLALHVYAALGEGPDSGFLRGAERLFDRAVSDGWAVDGADGFIYTTDWDGKPVVRQRMHWVLAEGISAAAALAATTADPTYEAWYRRWWDYAQAHLIQLDGSWIHELDPQNGPAATVWPGRPDLYHSVHAVLLPRLPLSPTAATAVREGRLA